ncbi:MAG: Hsp20/alpha crystallin family protein [Bauldia sp.]
MGNVATKLAVNNTPKAPATQTAGAAGFGSLRRQMERLFDDFDRGFFNWPARLPTFDFAPFGERGTGVAMPAVDIVEKDKAYEITAELPGLDEKAISVSLANGTLSIKGEKSEEKEEKEKDYYLSERRYGAFERAFRVPEGVDTAKIDANFRNGVLTVTLPKTAEAQKPEKTIAVKAA